MDNTNNDAVTMLTTTDNPFNPFTHYDEWYSYDINKGYNTCAYLARVTKTSEELSDADQEVAINNAMKEIVDLNVTGNYIIVTEKNFINRL
jgi:hypothetical protein